MSWIVLGEEKGRIRLISKTRVPSEMPGLLPKGSYLTIENKKTNSLFILRVDDSVQIEPYRPSPLIVDMDLEGLYGDTSCQNIISAFRIKDVTHRDDGKIDFIHPQSLARRSTQEEIDLALGNNTVGPRVFIATVHGGQNQLLIDNERNYITARLPEDMFYHQMMICGKTGSGKTVAMKYLVQYFIEEMGGAVLAINVKDIDFLRMDQASNTQNPQVLKEWGVLNQIPHGIVNCTIYYPANTQIESFKGVNHKIAKKITLNVNTIEPEALTGLLQNISEVGAMNFPDIFRYWQEEWDDDEKTFSNFVAYFLKAQSNPTFDTKNSRGDIAQVTLHRGTYQNILRNLNYSLAFFDNEDADTLDYRDILYEGKLSVINVAGEKGIQFGSILLRHLLKRIVQAKSQRETDVPILVIIDEVHQFYNTESSREALGDLDTICRTGRSQKIGVVFASQNHDDIPRGLANVINTKIFLKTDGLPGRMTGVSNEEVQTLAPGYAVGNIHNLSQLKTMKFPLSLAGVIEEE